jgi:transposase
MQVAEDAVKVPKPRFIQLNRAQCYWGDIDLEKLIEPDHPARAIWSLAGRLDLSSFEEEMRSREGTAGAPRHSPQLLVSVWIYGYSQGIASARALERMMSHEPGLRWLCADSRINYHTLSDFRSHQKETLNGLFAEVLAVMEEEGLLDLRTLMQDGTKVRALAGKGSFHREGTLRSKYEQAQAVVEELEKQSEKESGEKEEKRRTAARQRAAQERLQRMEASLEELKARQESVAPGKQDELRVSDSEPEARKMLQNDGGFASSYNMQITTEAKSKMVVSIEVVNEVNDTQQLVPALDRVQEQYGAQPEQIVADGGYATRENVEAAESRQVELVAPWKDNESREAGARKTNDLDPEFAHRGSK